MSIQDEFKRSAENLKKTVPLMLKYKVPTTPANYALWYTYVEESHPKLNEAIDLTVEQYGNCPPSVNNSLYSQFIAQEHETEFNDLKVSVEKLLLQLSNSMSDTINETSTFSNQLEKSCQNLEQIEDGKFSVEEITSLVKKVISETQDLSHSTKDLESKLTNSSKEIEQLKDQLEQVKHQSLLDSLTGLKNRQSFDYDIAMVTSSNKPICLIILDVDHFKSFNDQFGHQFGDAVLKAIGNRMSSLCRDQITAYRYGGEEFALIIPNKTLSMARQFADNIRRSLEKISIKDRKSGTMVGTITASFGVAQVQSDDSIDSFIERADSLMYEAKKLGRNRVMPML
ncbi:diguanylate cyclase [Vibrio sp. RC27]